MDYLLVLKDYPLHFHWLSRVLYSSLTLNRYPKYPFAADIVDILVLISSIFSKYFHLNFLGFFLNIFSLHFRMHFCFSCLIFCNLNGNCCKTVFCPCCVRVFFLVGEPSRLECALKLFLAKRYVDSTSRDYSRFLTVSGSLWVECGGVRTLPACAISHSTAHEVGATLGWFSLAMP